MAQIRFPQIHSTSAANTADLHSMCAIVSFSSATVADHGLSGRVIGMGGGRGGGGRGGGGGGRGGGGGQESGKRYSLTFSLNFQNLLNHTNEANPIGNLSSTLFGISTSSGGNFGGFGGLNSN